MTQLRVVHPSGYGPERRYAVESLFGTILGLPVEVVEGRVDAWQVVCEGETLEVPDVLFRTPAEEWLTPTSLPAGPELYGDDFFGNVFFLLTRYEELAVPARDEHGRFVPQASVSASALGRPLAHELGEALWGRLRVIAPRLERPSRTFRIVPSHDVDYPFASLKHRIALTRRGRASALLGDPFDTFEFLMSTSERNGHVAAFYFLMDDSLYPVDDPRVRALIRRIHERGHEIGYHAGYEAFHDPKRTASEFARLVRTCEEEGIEQDAWGGRAHFLRWDPDTWRSWEEAGLAYDSSVGYSSTPGFRSGACVEYPVFDLRSRTALALCERPLVLMDNPTLGSVSDPRAEIERLRAVCRDVGGDFTTVWHNSWITTPGRRRLCEAALEAA